MNPKQAVLALGLLYAAVATGVAGVIFDIVILVQL